MMLPWIGYALLTAAAFSALGALLEHSLGGRWMARRFIWLGVMAATVAIPIVGSLVASPRVVAMSTAPVAVVAAAPASAPMSLDRIVSLAWISVSVIIVLCLVASHLTLRRRLRGCERAVIDDDTAFVSEDFGPAVVGVVHPEIVVPKWALALSDTDQRLVVTHEREHIRAHDPALNALGLTFAVLFPWNATLWWQLKRLRLAIEIDCDARVVRRGHDPVRYGELLVSAHASITRRVAPVLALAQHRSALGRRIEALVSSPRRSVARGLVTVAFAGALVAAIAAAPPPTLREHIQFIAVEKPVTSAPLSATNDAVVTTPAAVPTARRAARRASIAVALPPASVTPNKLDAELTTLPRPTAAPMPVNRARGGAGGRIGGFGGFMVPAGQSGVATGAMAGPLSTRPDTVAARGGVIRAVRRDSTPP